MPNTKKAISTNERLRELVRGSGLSQADSLAVFNNGLGPAAYSLDTWKAFLAKPEAKRFRPLKQDLLAHAEKAFGLMKENA